MAGEAQPSRSPDDTAPMRTAMAGTKMARPAQSKRARSARWRLRGMNNHAATIPRRPTGTFTRKISRHPPVASSSPPAAGPRAKPSAWAAPWTPMARPSELEGTAR